jgi:hypothetical protein
MWLALVVPLVLMAVAVLMERFERRYFRSTGTPDLAESTVDLRGQGRT